jgi:hypothetical protein
MGWIGLQSVPSSLTEMDTIQVGLWYRRASDVAREACAVECVAATEIFEYSSHSLQHGVCIVDNFFTEVRTFLMTSTMAAMAVVIAHATATSSRALVMPSVLADDMVLAAAPRHAVLWGTATAGEDVAVTFTGACA